MNRRCSPKRFGALATLLAAVVGCGRSAEQPSASASPAASGGSAAEAAPPAQAIRVEPDRVVLEGRWQPVGGASSSSVSVSVTCARKERRCREELTSAAEGQATARETLQYAIREWTPRKLVAVRQASGRDIELRVAFTAVQAEKAVIEKRAGKTVETRWRLD